jgi:hypothetical protein
VGLGWGRRCRCKACELMDLDDVVAAARTEPAWGEAIEDVLGGQDRGVHLAVLVEPYLQFVLDRTKTIESRFSRRRCPPFGRVSEGDVILLKRAGGPVIGLCTVSDVWSYQVEPGTLTEIRDRFGSAIQPQDGFWDDRREAAFATLMRVEGARTLPDIRVPKRDRRGWVVLREQRTPYLL